MDLQNKPVALREWLDEVVQHVRGLAESKGLKMERNLDSGLPETVSGDPGRLKQIAINLLSNAIKFTEKGEVRIGVAKHARDAWRIEVTDTGPGIPSHLLETVFQEFRQVDSTTTRQHGGTGLGLAIVRRLALLMGGTVRVRSQVGEGSTFTVFLPLDENGRVESVVQATLTER
jgi:signal transduction histidine kinase